MPSRSLAAGVVRAGNVVLATTEVDEPLEELRDEAYAINVLKSGTDLKTYVACGDIGSGSGGADTNTSTGNGY